MKSIKNKWWSAVVFLALSASPLLAANPRGFLDLATLADGIQGWACDADHYSRALEIHIYADNQAGQPGARFIVSTTANRGRETGVYNACGGFSEHGYAIPIPDILKDNKTHKIYAYAINVWEGNNTLLENSPKTLPAIPSGADPRGFLDYAGSAGFFGWACDADNYNQALSVHIYADGPAGQGKMVTSGTANVVREAGVGAACGGKTAHGYVIPIPDILKDNKPHTIYAYAINNGPGNNPLLENSPKTLPAIPSGADPRGFLDYAGSAGFFGWACDADNYNQALSVHIYADGPAGQGKMVTSGTANVVREAGVGAACGGKTAHGYVIPIPDILKDNKPHTIYAYAINNGPGNNPLLENSPKTLPAISPPADPIGFLDQAGAAGIIGWTCDADNFNQALSVHIYADGPAGQGKMVTSGTANVVREAAVGAACGGKTAHGYVIPIPAILKDNKPHTIHAYAINNGAGNNPLLKNSPKTLPAIPPPADPIGFLDTVSSAAIVGWTCDADNFNQALSVHIYADGPAGQGKMVTSGTANVVREAAVGAACGGKTAHGYVIPIPAILKDNKPHTIYAYAINNGVENNPLLKDSPKTLPAINLPFSSPLGISGPVTKWVCSDTVYMGPPQVKVYSSGATSAMAQVSSANLPSASEVAPPANCICDVQVNSTPSGAHIWYSRDGVTWSDSGKTTNHTFSKIGRGTYWVKLTKDGYADWIKGFALTVNGRTLNPTLIRAGTPGSITVNSTPADAHIYYSTDDFNYTDSKHSTNRTFDNIPPGYYQVKLLKDGYGTWQKTVVLEAGKNVTLDAALLSGDKQISAPFDGSQITIKTASHFAGAISSLVWKGKEFVNISDHGRQIQSASSFDKNGEEFNPTESGTGFEPYPNFSTSILEAISASGNTLSTRTRMAFWRAPFNRTVVNDETLSNHILSKTVTIGYQGIPNVVDYQVTFTVPEEHSSATFEALTPYLVADFSKFWAYNPTTKQKKVLSRGPGAQALPVILATQDGNYALAVYSPDLPQLPPYTMGGGYGRWNFDSNNVVKSNIAFIRDHTPIGDYSFRCFLAVGTLDQVHRALDQLVAKLPPVNPALPMGVLDGATASGISGWVCDSDNYDEALTVRVYADGPKGTGSYVTSVVANATRERAVGDVCGDNPAHGYYLPLPETLKNGKSRSIYVYATNIGPAVNIGSAGNDTLLYGSPMTLSPTSARAAIAVGTSESFTADSARAYPVPIRPGRGGALGITFDRIPAGIHILIFNVENQLTKTLTTKYPGEAFWDLTNAEGASVPSGIYSAIIEVDGVKKRLKLVVQR